MSMKTIIISLKVFLFFTVLTGVIYPLFVTGMAQILFPGKANGSIEWKDKKPIGSVLIGQKFDSIIYFHSRPSAMNYNPLPSGGSNLGLTSSTLKGIVNERKLKFLADNELDSLTVIPSEMLFASASGLDPHISAKAAFLQVNRIVKARNFNSKQKEQLLQSITQQTEGPQFLVFGQERVNVLLLNLALDKIQ